MAKKSVFELESDADVQEWHDNAYAEYEEALAAYTKATDRKDPNGVDAKTAKKYEDARDNLIAGTQYWRQVGEAVGTRTGIAVVDHVNTPEDDQ